MLITHTLDNIYLASINSFISQLLNMFRGNCYAKI